MIDTYFNNIVKEVNILFDIPILFINKKNKNYKLIFENIKTIDEFFKYDDDNGNKINSKPFIKNNLCYVVYALENNNHIVKGCDDFNEFGKILNYALNKIYLNKIFEEKQVRKKYYKKLNKKSRYFYENLSLIQDKYLSKY